MRELIGRRLVDTSAWHLSGRGPVAESWEEALAEDRLVMCAQVELEILFSARSHSDYEALAQELSALPHVPSGERAFERALDVQARLAAAGGLHHRSVKVPDLIIAATAELAGLPVWHYNEHFDRIAGITGQRCEWIAVRGSL